MTTLTTHTVTSADVAFLTSLVKPTVAGVRELRRQLRVFGRSYWGRGLRADHARGTRQVGHGHGYATAEIRHWFREMRDVHGPDARALLRQLFAEEAADELDPVNWTDEYLLEWHGKLRGWGVVKLDFVPWVKACADNDTSNMQERCVRWLHDRGILTAKDVEQLKATMPTVGYRPLTLLRAGQSADSVEIDGDSQERRWRGSDEYRLPQVKRTRYPRGQEHERYLATISWGRGKHATKRRTRAQVVSLRDQLTRLLDDVTPDDLAVAALEHAAQVATILQHGYPKDPARRAHAARVASDRLADTLRDLCLMLDSEEPNQ